MSLRGACIIWVDRRGLVTSRNLYIRRLHPWDDYNDVLDYDRSGVVGLNKEFLAIYSMLDSPPEMRGFAQLMVKYLNAPGKRLNSCPGMLGAQG